jgi:hypothetical protein
VLVRRLATPDGRVRAQRDGENDEEHQREHSHRQVGASGISSQRLGSPGQSVEWIEMRTGWSLQAPMMSVKTTAGRRRQASSKRPR